MPTNSARTTTWRTRKVTPAVAARDPVKEAAVTRRDIRGLVLEMDPDRAKAVERALDLARTMDLALVPRDTRAAVDMAPAMEMEAVPRDIRAAALEMETVMDQVPREAPNLDLNLMMDTHPWTVIRCTNH